MSDDNESISTVEAEGKPRRKLSRGERKARKLILKNNEKRMENVSRVVFRQNDGSLYVIDSPDVYKHSTADTFIVFGEIVDINTSLNKIQTSKAAMEINTSIAAQNKMESVDNSEEDDDSTDIDENGLNSLDIELVMTQANVTRRKAILALKRNTNDLVNTIMDLTQ